MSERERRLREYDEFRRREEAAARDAPRDVPRTPAAMRVRMPLGCAVMIAALVVVAGLVLLRVMQSVLGH